jgi:flagellar L-ring protein precursor FlgH
MSPYVSTDSPIPSGEPNSPGTLWRSGPQSLFGDRRARNIGDIVTVVVEIDDEAEIRNRSERQRDASEELSAPALLGVNTLVQRVLPGGAGLDPAIDASSRSESNGEGAIRRRERITLRVAATVTEALQNGNLVVQGSQEVRVNNELRDLRVRGVVRREDISRTNVITYDKIAEARISYGGRGEITRVNGTRYGQKLLDLISPF